MNENEIKTKSSMGIASLTLGILSIIFSIFWYIALPTGILAIIFGAKSTKKMGSKLGKAGLITGIVGLALFAFIYSSLIILMLVSSIL